MGVKGVLLLFVMDVPTGNEPYKAELIETFLSSEFYPIWQEAGLVQYLYPPKDVVTEVQSIRPQFVSALIDMLLRKRDYMNVIPVPVGTNYMNGEEADAYREVKLYEAMWKVAQLSYWMERYPLSHLENRE